LDKKAIGNDVAMILQAKEPMIVVSIAPSRPELINSVWAVCGTPKIAGIGSSSLSV
jgi:hypothetical protein